MSNITGFSHNIHPFEISDHASLSFTIDFEQAPQGIGTFKAHPLILKHTSYKTLIHNVLRHAIIDGLSDKTSDFYNECITNLINKSSIQEEIVTLEMIKLEYNWPIDERLNELQCQLLHNFESEIPLSDILSKELTTDPKHLLDSVISDWKTHTELYMKELKMQRQDKQTQINTKLNKLRELIDDDTEQPQVQALEDELSLLKEAFTRVFISSMTAKSHQLSLTSKRERLAIVT